MEEPKSGTGILEKLGPGACVQEALRRAGDRKAGERGVRDRIN